MSTIAHLAQALRTLMTTTADTLAIDTGFVQRQRLLSGATFAQTLVFGWLADPEATVEARSQTAASACALRISPQGLEQRLMTEAAATFLHRLLEEALETLVRADPVAIPILRHFTGVYLYEIGTVVALPDALKEHYWPGCGGGSSNPSGAALKIGVGLDLLSGALAGPVLGPGRVHDRALLELALEALPEGALQVADLWGFSISSCLAPLILRAPIGFRALRPAPLYAIRRGEAHDVTIWSSC